MSENVHLVFMLGRSTYAINALMVREIFWLPAYTPMETVPAGVVGLIDLRGRIIPVISLEILFNHPPTPSRLNDQLVVLEHAGALIGIIVHEVLQVTPLSAGAIQPFPDCSVVHKTEAKYLSGVVDLETGLAHVLNSPAFFDLTALHLPPCEEGISTGEDKEQAYVQLDRKPEIDAVFKERALQLRQPLADISQEDRLAVAILSLGREVFAVEAEWVREFAPLRNVTPVPCCPPCIVGQMNLRGELLTVLDIRDILNLSPAGNGNPAKVVVVQVGPLVAGILVEAVHDVVYLRPSDVAPAPVAAQVQSRNYIKGVAACDDKMLCLVDIQKVFTRGECVVNEVV
ncbi:MAG: chemotaxis protein CheW [bacterium]